MRRPWNHRSLRESTLRRSPGLTGTFPFEEVRPRGGLSAKPRAQAWNTGARRPLESWTITGKAGMSGTIAAREQEAVELLQKLVRNRCVNDGTADASELANSDDLEAILDGCGADIAHHDAAPGRRSLVARLPGTDPDAPTLTLLAHTDVVPADASRWTFDPFGGEIHDGFVYGRGTIDMLGHAATMALAFRDHARLGHHRGGDLVFLAVADEEALGTYGCGWLDSNHPDTLETDWVITEFGGLVRMPDAASPPGTPPMITALAGDKGALRIELTLDGSPGHGSVPYCRESVVEAIADVISRIDQARNQIVITQEWERVVRASFPERVQSILLDPARIDDALPGMPQMVARMTHALTRMTATVTTVTTNGSWNTAASRATLGIDMRLLPGQTRADVLAWLSAALEGMNCRREVVVVAEASPSSSTPQGPLWDLMQQAARVQVPGAMLRPAMAPSGTDARYFRKRGATAFGFGLYSQRMQPEWIPEMMHGDDERVDIESIGAMRTLWDSVIELHSLHR